MFTNEVELIVDQQDLLVNTTQVWFIFITRRTDVLWSASPFLREPYIKMFVSSPWNFEKNRALSVDKLVHQSDSGYVVESNVVLPLK